MGSNRGVGVMTTVLDNKVALHIFKHIEQTWEVTLPTGDALEIAIARGFKDNNKHNVRTFGSPNTITDVAIDNICLDIKGRGVARLLDKLTKSQDHTKNIYIPVKFDSKGFFISIPKSVMTQARRPQTELDNYQGDAKKTLIEQANEYVDFARRTSASDGCDEIVSVIHLYGTDKGYKISVLTETVFEEHVIDTAETIYNKNGNPAAYQGYNTEGSVVYKLSSFNKGSSNMEKRYYTTKLYYRIWKDTPYQPNSITPVLSGSIGQQ
jgi:hypothetical protein